MRPLSSLQTNKQTTTKQANIVIDKHFSSQIRSFLREWKTWKTCQLFHQSIIDQTQHGRINKTFMKLNEPTEAINRQHEAYLVASTDSFRTSSHFDTNPQSGTLRQRRPALNTRVHHFVEMRRGRRHSKLSLLSPPANSS